MAETPLSLKGDFGKDAGREYRKLTALEEEDIILQSARSQDGEFDRTPNRNLGNMNESQVASQELPVSRGQGVNPAGRKKENVKQMMLQLDLE